MHEAVLVTVVPTTVQVGTAATVARAKMTVLQTVKVIHAAVFATACNALHAASEETAQKPAAGTSVVTSATARAAPRNAQGPGARTAVGLSRRLAVTSAAG